MQEDVTGVTGLSGVVFSITPEGNVQATLPIMVGQVTGVGETYLQAFRRAVSLRNELTATIEAVLAQETGQEGLYN
jgi:hypothetical protein